MRLLAVDTATARGSVALAQDEEILGEVRFVSPDRHSTRLLPAVEFVLKTLDLDPRDVDGYAVCVGPGPFTGLRVGISTVQGLAIAGGRKAVGATSLDVLAARIRGEADTLVALIDAGRGQVYGALYDRDAVALGPPALATPENFLERVPDGAAFLGDGVLPLKARITAARPRSVFPERSLFLAGTLARLAGGNFERALDPSALRPLYLRGADIRRADQPEPR